MEDSIFALLSEILFVIGDKSPNFYIYGSVATGDFQLGWSDINFVCLLEKSLDEEKAKKLLDLKKNLIKRNNENPYLRLFHGVFMSIPAFTDGRKDKVVCWEKDGEKLQNFYDFNSFVKYDLSQNGVLIFGEDIRDVFKMPTFDELREDIRKCCKSIRQFVDMPNTGIESFGCLLDISRYLYILKYGMVISKTSAGEWAIDNGLCPNIQALGTALSVRHDPLIFKNKEISGYSLTLTEAISDYCSVLEGELGI